MTDAPATPTGWTDVLDRLEERLRLIEVAARSGPGRPAPGLGPEPGPADRPALPPTPQERVRLLTLMQAHEQLGRRLDNRRRELRIAQRYELGGS